MKEPILRIIDMILYFGLIVTFCAIIFSATSLLSSCQTTKAQGITGPEPSRSVYESHFRQIAADEGVDVSSYDVRVIIDPVKAVDGGHALALSVLTPRGGTVYFRSNSEPHWIIRHEAAHPVRLLKYGSSDMAHTDKAFAKKHNLKGW